MTEQVIRAIEAALKRGLRVELLLDGGREELNGADRRNPAGSFFICKVR